MAVYHRKKKMWLCRLCGLLHKDGTPSENEQLAGLVRRRLQGKDRRQQRSGRDMVCSGGWCVHVNLHAKGENVDN